MKIPESLNFLLILSDTITSSCFRNWTKARKKTQQPNHIQNPPSNYTWQFVELQMIITSSLLTLTKHSVVTCRVLLSCLLSSKKTQLFVIIGVPAQMLWEALSVDESKFVGKMGNLGSWSSLRKLSRHLSHYLVYLQNELINLSRMLWFKPS